MSFWLFEIPNFLLAMGMYTLFARAVLSIFMEGTNLVMWKVFQQVTDPLLNTLRFITPLAVPDRLLVILGIIWLLFFRMALLLFATMYAVAPKIAG